MSAVAFLNIPMRGHVTPEADRPLADPPMPVTMLVIWVQSMAVFSAWRGDFAEATSLVAEGEAIAAATGTRHAPTGAVMLAGFRGAEAEAIPLIEAASRTGQTELAADVFRRLAETTSIAQTDWGRGSMRVTSAAQRW